MPTSVTRPSRRRALAMIASGAAVATTPAVAAAATDDPWLTLKASRDQLEAELDGLFAIWGERMRGLPDDIGDGKAHLYFSSSRTTDSVLISATTLEAMTADDAKESPAWCERLRLALAVELAERQREVDEVRARLGLDDLDAQTDRLSKRSETLDARLRQTEPTTLRGVVAKLRWMAANANDRGSLTVSADQLDSLAAAAAAVVDPR